MLKLLLHNDSGHTLIEIITVAAIMTILATIPVTYLREARVRANETAALGALNQLATAYEMYRVVGSSRDRVYPNFYADGSTDNFVIYRSPAEIWDKLIMEGLLPREYASFNHSTPDLLAPGYILSIYPIDYGVPSFYSVNPWDSYAFALLPKPGSRQPRTLALIHGDRFDHYFTNARALKSVDKSSDLSKVKIFTFKDPEPDD